MNNRHIINTVKAKGSKNHAGLADIE